MSFAGFCHAQPDSMQKLKKVRRRSSFFRAEMGAIAQVSRYPRISASDRELTDRLPNLSFNSVVSRVYLSTEASESLRASQSFRNASHAKATVTSSRWPEPPSQSRTNFCADSQFLRSRDFFNHFPCSVPCAQIGHWHFFWVRRVCGQAFMCLLYRFNTHTDHHGLERRWNAIFLFRI